MLYGNSLHLATHQAVIGLGRLQGDLRQLRVHMFERLGRGVCPIAVMQLVAQVTQPHALIVRLYAPNKGRQSLA
ncbi:hypothetical protein D3C77_593510 [compost metagenome]